MYAFSDELRAAWQTLFTHFIEILESPVPIAPGLAFDASESVLRDPALLLGHTCGYPLMTRYAGVLEPVAAPVFDVDGCNGPLYASHFIVAADSDLDSLAACRGGVVAINGYDSNSGMNVLRHALAALAPGERYFARAELTGAHAASVAAVADGRADLAAIDCVTLALLADADPGLVARVRSIGRSVQTAGLPFVAPSRSPHAGFCDSLNAALAEIAPEHRERLHLQRFQTVTRDDYAAILALESAAREAGYKILQ